MIKAIRVLSLSLLIVSCTKDDTPSGTLNGAYNGTYYQTGISKDSAYVQIVFVGSSFSGTGNGSMRSICNGTYGVVADSINFTNLCSIPDSDLLLVGKYRLSGSGDSLYFTRTYTTPAYTEIFSLKKQ